MSLSSPASSAPPTRRVIALLGIVIVFLLGVIGGLSCAPSGRNGGSSAGGVSGAFGAPGAAGGLTPSVGADPALAAPGAHGYKSRIAEVAARVSPAVVTINTARRVTYREPDFEDFFGQFVVPRPRLREAREENPYVGSGVLIDREGHVVTNFHVVDGASEYSVTFTDGSELPATIVAGDSYVDLALLKVAPSADFALPEPMPFGDRASLQIGETVIALGNPFGPVLADPRPTVTAGVISALGRSFRPDQQRMKVYHDMIQTDAAINPGNSGGPLVDIEGRMIGLNTFIVSRSGGSVGLGFAIPIDRIARLVEEVKAHGRLRPIRLDLDARTVRSGRYSAVLVDRVDDDGPAAEAGLQRGDVITAADGKPVLSTDDLLLFVAGKQIGESLELSVVRAGEELTLRYEVSTNEE
jgi:serine protease Do